MPFVKLDCGILDSTLWVDRLARELFITALLMAEPIELREPMTVLNGSSLVQDIHFKEIPPGWYGFVGAAGSGIIRRAGIQDKTAATALLRLAEPDYQSRSPAFQGRRMVRVDGGYIILNFDKYRNRDYTAAERSKRYRERQASRVSNVTSRVTSRNVTQAEAEAEAEAELTGTRDSLSLREELTESLKEILPPNEMQKNGSLWRQRINECPQAVAFAIEDYKVRTPDQRSTIRNLPAWLTDRHKRARKELLKP